MLELLDSEFAKCPEMNLAVDQANLLHTLKNRERFLINENHS
jgi:hypothetical protein